MATHAHPHPTARAAVPSCGRATAATAAIDEPPVTDADLEVDPRYSPVTVQCDMCGNQAVPLVTARIMSKRKGTWKCAKCNSSLVKVYRSQTSEATAGLLLMPEEEQKNELKKIMLTLTMQCYTLKKIYQKG